MSMNDNPPGQNEQDPQHKAPVPPEGGNKTGASTTSQPLPPRRLSHEPVLNLWGIQGDLLLGHAKEEEGLVFFEITSKEAFCTFLATVPITSSADVYRPVGREKAVLTGREPPNPRYSIAFTHEGLLALDAPEIKKIDAKHPFVEGLARRAAEELNDPDPADWVVGGSDSVVHGVFIVTSRLKGEAFNAVNQRLKAPGPRKGWREVYTQWGETRPGASTGKEHFGFMDGISQPGIRGRLEERFNAPLTENADPVNKPNQGLPGQDLLWPGEFVFGYPGQDDPQGKRPPQDPERDPMFARKGPVVQPPLPWMRDGAFLVIRRLTQRVPEMREDVAAKVRGAAMSPARLRAELVGRWPSGAPILDPDATEEDNAAVGANETLNNDFEFGGDRDGLVCPWAAHIRKTYPRDDVFGSAGRGGLPTKEEVTIAEAATQTHRMLRRGIQFGPELTEGEVRSHTTEKDRGLLFKCYVTSIEEQFEFVQRSWCNNPAFVQTGAGHDVIIGQASTGGHARTFLGAGAVGSKPSFTFHPWVTMTGGGYFFAPSLDFLRSAFMQGPASG